MAKDFTLTRPAGQSSPVVAGGALIRPGKSIDIDLSSVDPSIFDHVESGALTSVPVMAPEIIEAGKSAQRTNSKRIRPVETAEDFKRAVNIKSALDAAFKDTKVVMASSDSPKAKATGVTVRLEVQDASSRRDWQCDALEAQISISGLGNTTFVIDDDYTPPSGSANTIRFRNGLAIVKVTGTVAGTGTLQMSASSRGTLLDISDTASVQLT